jgi:hypothetical protein
LEATNKNLEDCCEKNYEAEAETVGFWSLVADTRYLMQDKFLNVMPDLIRHPAALQFERTLDSGSSPE